MSAALEAARAVLARHESQNAYDPFHYPLTDHRYVALRALIAEHEALIREMHQRELHHFEVEKLLTEAGIDPDDMGEAKRAVERLTTPPTDDERGALVDHALRIASKGVQINDGHTYSVHAHDLVDYAETIRALVLEIRRQGPITDERTPGPCRCEGCRPGAEQRAALEAARDA